MENFSEQAMQSHHMRPLSNGGRDGARGAIISDAIGFLQCTKSGFLLTRFPLICNFLKPG
jgi:hypothetical protein